MRADKLDRTLALATGMALLGWFIRLVRGGLASWFDADDLMNLHYYWSRPWSALLEANLAFWSSYYRPGGGLFYRTIYAVWGFHALPFRIAALTLLVINFALLAVVVWQMTGCRWAALIALLLVGINPSFSYAYFDTGAIYDVLAYTFFWGAFALYVYFRQGGRIPGGARLALVFGLFVAALDSKEIAVTLPIAVLFYELAWHPPADWKPAELYRWIRREGRFAVLGGLADVAYIVGKRYGADSLWQTESYRPHVSPAAYFQASAYYLRQLTYGSWPTTGWQMAGLLAALLGLAAVTRRRALLWGIGFVLAGVLPLAFIPPRSGFAYLAPSVGWTVYGAGLLVWIAESAAGRRAWLRTGLLAILLAALAVRVAHWQRKELEMQASAAHERQARYRYYIDQIRALIPDPRKGAHILLLSDVNGQDDFDVYFVMRLYYGDPTLVVHRMTVWKAHHVQVDPRGYDYVLDSVGNRFLLVSHK